MLSSLMLRKLIRILKTGSPYTPSYRAYRLFLQEGSSDNNATSYFNLTIDFELAWSRARRNETSTTKEESLERSRRAREILPVLLSLSEKYNIPITFATVGHVAVENCDEHISPPSFHPCWTKEDWYKFCPRTNVTVDPDYYGSDLITKIKSSPIKHEIASHSFSHVDLSDSETTFKVAQFEIEESYRLLKKVYPELKTYVFAKNRPAFMDLIQKIGFVIFRSDKNQPIRKNEDGLIEFPLGLWLSPKAHSPKNLMQLLEIAVQKKRLINFWFHLYEFSSSKEFFQYFQPIFSYINNYQNVDKMKALTMQDIANALYE